MFRIIEMNQPISWFGSVLCVLPVHAERERVCVQYMYIAQWLERRTLDRKIPGSSPGRSGGRMFFSRVKFLC